MFFYEGLSCPVCNGVFGETDDIVGCPVCGAPHHRDCWKKIGHCYGEAWHGTEQQWKRPVPPTDSAVSSPSPAPLYQIPFGNRCAHCNTLNPPYAEICSGCGHALSATDWSAHSSPSAQQRPTGRYNEYIPFQRPMADPYAGLPGNEMIGGIPVSEFAALVGANTAYYLPRFHRMSCSVRTIKSRASWNWPAFLLTPYWLLYRKQYAAGAVMLLFFIVTAILTNVLLAPLLGNNPLTFNVALQLSASGLLDQIALPVLLIAVSELLIRLIFGLFGNVLYQSLCVKRHRRVMETHPDNVALALTKTGGVSLSLGTMGYLLWYLVTWAVNFM